jgi:hypothetical protein
MIGRRVRTWMRRLCGWNDPPRDALLYSYGRDTFVVFCCKCGGSVIIKAALQEVVVVAWMEVCELLHVSESEQVLDARQDSLVPLHYGIGDRMPAARLGAIQADTDVSDDRFGRLLASLVLAVWGRVVVPLPLLIIQLPLALPPKLLLVPNMVVRYSGTATRS